MPSPLLTAATSTFESLALLFAESPPSGAQANAPLTYAVRVAFAGPCAGALDVAVSDDVAVALAANMLGLDPDAVRADAGVRQDAVGELANVVCGNVLPLVAGREVVFHLAAPVARPVPTANDAPPHGAALTETLGVDGGRAVLTLVLDDPAPLRLLP
ncbi:MAG: chemotaxis protein CheX [Gemmatirosa sp.]